MKNIRKIMALLTVAAMVMLAAGCGSSSGALKKGSEFTLGENTFMYQETARSGDTMSVTLYVKGDGSIKIGGSLGGGLSAIVPVDVVLGEDDASAIRANTVTLDSNGGTEGYKLSMVFNFNIAGVETVPDVAKVIDKADTNNTALLDISGTN